MRDSHGQCSCQDHQGGEGKAAAGSPHGRGLGWVGHLPATSGQGARVVGAVPLAAVSVTVHPAVAPRTRHLAYAGACGALHLALAFRAALNAFCGRTPHRLTVVPALLSTAVGGAVYPTLAFGACLEAGIRCAVQLAATAGARLLTSLRPGAAGQVAQASGAGELAGVGSAVHLTRAFTRLAAFMRRPIAREPAVLTRAGLRAFPRRA